MPASPFLDTADIYGGAGASETLMGEVLPRTSAPRSSRRPTVPPARTASLERFAQARGIPLIDVAIGALLAQPAVASVIAGATRPEQVAANVAAAAWVPTEADRAELASLPAG